MKPVLMTTYLDPTVQEVCDSYEIKCIWTHWKSKTAADPRKTVPRGEKAEQLCITKSAKTKQRVSNKSDRMQCLKKKEFPVDFSTCSQLLTSNAFWQRWGHTSPSLQTPGSDNPCSLLYSFSLSSFQILVSGLTFSSRALTSTRDPTTFWSVPSFREFTKKCPR